MSHLCQGDIASVSEWGDDQAICASKVLVLVVEVHICDSDHHLLQACFEVEPVQALLSFFLQILQFTQFTFLSAQKCAQKVLSPERTKKSAKKSTLAREYSKKCSKKCSKKHSKKYSRPRALNKVIKEVLKKVLLSESTKKCAEKKWSKKVSRPRVIEKELQRVLSQKSTSKRWK